MDVLARLQPIALAQNGYVTRPQANAAGVTDQQLLRSLRAGVLLRRHRGVYVLGADYDDGGLGSVARSLKAVVSHESAALLYGADVLTTPPRRQLIVPGNRGRRVDEVTGVRLHRQDLGQRDVVMFGSLLVTTPLRTAVDIARARPTLDALVVIDSMVRRQLISHEALIAEVRSLSRGPGRKAARLVAGLVDARAQSAFESKARYVLWRHDLAPDELQVPVYDPWSRRTIHGDMGWKKARAVGECDGFVFHTAREPFRLDRLRANAYTRARLWQLHFTWEDLDDEPYLVDLVSAVVRSGE